MMDLQNELTMGPLKDELSPLIVTGDIEAIVTILNRKDINSIGRLSAHDIRQYLMLVDLLIPIEMSTALSCVITTRSLDIFTEFDLTNPIILTKFTAILDMLVAETLIPDFTETHKATLLYLAQKKVSRAEQLGFPITTFEVSSAIFNDDGTRRI